VLYFGTKDGQHIVVLEPENMEALKSGLFAKTPNKSVLIAYTPDSAWLGEQIMMNADKLDPETLERLILESQRRPEKRGRAQHPMLEVIKDGKVQGRHE